MPISRIETNSIAPSQTLTTPIIATTMGVGGATPSASGSGITFPATQSASTDANTLDDYEEGSWTPSIAGTSIVMGSGNAGSYTKIGRMVFFQAFVILSSGTPTGAQITGLPFVTPNSDNSNYAMGVSMFNNSGIAFPASKTYPSFYVNRSSSSIFMEASGSSQPSAGLTLSSSFSIYVAGCYISAA